MYFVFPWVVRELGCVFVVDFFALQLVFGLSIWLPSGQTPNIAQMEKQVVVLSTFLCYIILVQCLTLSLQ